MKYLNKKLFYVRLILVLLFFLSGYYTIILSTHVYIGLILIVVGTLIFMYHFFKGLEILNNDDYGR